MQRPSSTTSEKSFAAGTIAETVEKLGPCCPPEILKNVVPRFIQLSRFVFNPFQIILNCIWKTVKSVVAPNVLQI